MNMPFAIDLSHRDDALYFVIGWLRKGVGNLAFMTYLKHFV